jgi:TRAP-type C4-dicarboxylate transport system substrate-binding protein
MALNGRRALAAAGLAGSVLLLAACAGSATTDAPTESGGDAFAQMEPMTLTFNHTNPPGGHFEAATVAFTDYIEEETDGKVTFETFYSGSLLPAAEVFTGVGTGLADISYTTTIGFEDRFPIADWLSPAMSVDPLPYPLGDLANYLAANDFIANEPALQAEYEALNVKPLWFVSASPGDMLCTDPVGDLDEASGKLTRSPSAQITAEVEALGMTPISMPFSDLYEGLQRGAVECVYTTAGNTTFKPYSLTEVAKNYAAVNGWVPIAAAGFVMNLDLWNSFPEELQQVFHEASLESMAVHSEGAFDVVAEFGATAEEDGVEFLETDELREVIADLHAELYDGLADDAPSGVENPDELMQHLVDTRAKWAELLEDGVVQVPEEAAVDGEGLRDAFASSADLVDWDALLALIQEQDADAG